MTLTRRGLIRGMGTLLAAPAIVRVASLMPVRSLADDLLAGIAADEASRLVRVNVLTELSQKEVVGYRLGAIVERIIITRAELRACQLIGLPPYEYLRLRDLTA